MSHHLQHLYTWLLPLLHPGVTDAAVKFTCGLAEWVQERDAAGTPVYDFNDIAGWNWPTLPLAEARTVNRLECRLGRIRMAQEFPGYEHRAGATDKGAAAARAAGLVTATYQVNRDTGAVDNHPTHFLVPVLEAALTRAAMRRDVIAHLEVHPLGTIQISGVLPRGAGKADVITEEHHPATATEAADLLLRKVDAEFVGRLGGKDHSDWVPTGFEAARALRQLAEAHTGHPMVVSDVPTVRYHGGSRPVVTPEMDALLPALAKLPSKMRIDPRVAEEASRPSGAATPGPATPAATSRPRSPKPTSRARRGTSAKVTSAQLARQKMAEREAVTA